jgi:hypothetical protein
MWTTGVAVDPGAAVCVEALVMVINGVVETTGSGDPVGWDNVDGGAVAAGLGSEAEVFHRMTTMIKPMMPAAMMSDHKFVFKGAPLLLN